MIGTAPDMGDAADWTESRRNTCSTCGKPIRATDASIHSGTSRGREQWHLTPACCPWLRKAPPEIAEDRP
jgi:hypothetical protein